MKLEAQRLLGRVVSLDPVGLEMAGPEMVTPEMKEEVRALVHSDREAWEIMRENALDEHFETYWSGMCGALRGERVPYVIRQPVDGRIVGVASFYTQIENEGGVEIGSTFLHPEVRSGAVNPEAKLLMLEHAFRRGAVRVQFRVDTRNQRSQAAVAKLGAVREGVLRKDRVTWTGYIRDTAYFSILDREWPAVKSRLEQRLQALGVERE